MTSSTLYFQTVCVPHGFVTVTARFFPDRVPGVVDLTKAEEVDLTKDCEDVVDLTGEPEELEEVVVLEPEESVATLVLRNRVVFRNNAS